MIREPAARRYAQAAFELAEERGDFDAWLEDLEGLADAFDEPAVARALTSERVSVAERERIIQQAAPGIRPLPWNLVRLLLSRGRIRLLPEVAEALRELVEERQGIVRAVVTTAVELDEEGRRSIAGRLGQLTGKQVLVETQVDESILGGLVARIGDRLIDGSARTKLAALKASLEGRR